jgi:NTE family protein
MAFQRPDVLVLGAGGILGEAWMAGLLAGIEQADGFDARECDAFVGTSAGSIVAAALAGGVNPASRLDRIPSQPPVEDSERIAGSLIGQALRFGRVAGAAAFGPLAALMLWSTTAGGAVVRRTALARVPRGRRSLARVGHWIDGLGVGWDGRLLVAAVDVDSGRRVAFGELGEERLTVGQAVQASCAIPGVFRPIEAKDGASYVDGGAWSLTNLDLAPVKRGTRVLCLNPTGAMTAAAGVRGAVGPLSRGVAAVEALALQRRGARVTHVAPDADASAAMGGNFMDGARRAATQEAGFAQGVRLAAGDQARAA